MRLKNNMQLDELLGKIVFLSYQYTWIFAASGLISAYINALSSAFTRSPILSSLVGIILSIFAERVLKPIFTRGLLWFNKHSDKPMKDPRLLPFFDGWSAFITAIVIFVVLDGVFHIEPNPNMDINFYLAGLSAGVFVLILIYGIITGKI